MEGGGWVSLHAFSASALDEGAWPVSHTWISLDKGTAFNPLKTKFFCFIHPIVHNPDKNRLHRFLVQKGAHIEHLM